MIIALIKYILELICTKTTHIYIRQKMGNKNKTEEIQNAYLEIYVEKDNLHLQFTKI